MSVDIGQAIQEGGKRTFARNGLYLVVITWVLSVLSGLFSASVVRGMLQDFPGQGPMAPAPMGPSLGLSPAVAGILSLLVSLVGLVVAAATIRTFVTDDTETLPGSRFTRNLVWMVVNLIVGWIVFSIVVGIGFVLLVLPGIFLLVSLFFWNVYVIVEDQNFIEGFQNSWALTRGNRIMLFILGVVVVIIGVVISWIFSVPQLVGLTGWIGLLVSTIGSAFVAVFLQATVARTYVQLTTDESATVAE